MKRLPPPEAIIIALLVAFAWAGGWLAWSEWK